MSTTIRMPELIAGSESAAISAWLVAIGDEVAAGQEIVEIETDKASIEYAAEEDGVLAKILVEAGESVPVGTPIAVLTVPGEDAEEIAEVTSAQPASVGDDPTPEPKTEATDREAAMTDSEPAPSPTSCAETAPATPASPGRTFASPLVRKLARERGLDLSRVSGSGPGGRIVRRDLENLPQLSTSAEAEAPTKEPAAPQPASTAPLEPVNYTEIPLSGMRKAIARRLTESKTTAPHFYLVADVRVDSLLALRKQINSLEGVKVSVNDFVVKAVAGALLDVPEANATWAETAIRRYHTVDIAVAVAVDDGLLTPVVRAVDGLSLTSLNSQIKDYATRARDGKLKQPELEGGTMTVSNLGMYGTSQFSAILNPPQAGILAVGAAQQRPVVNEDGELEVGTVMTVTLSADHRVIDGAVGARWLEAFTKRIENPMTILV